MVLLAGVDELDALALILERRALVTLCRLILGETTVLAVFLGQAHQVIRTN